MKDGKYIVVHVDDSLLAREMVKEALQEAGYEVHNAENAQDFEQRLMADEEFRRRVDFIVLDMEMPDLTGAQVGAVVEAVYDELGQTPFVIFSAKSKDWVEAMAREVAEASPGFKRNYKGYVGKQEGGARELVDRLKFYCPIREGG